MTDRQFRCVGIVGVGLIGASIGLALKRRGLAASVLGIGRRGESLREAARLGAIDRATVGLGDALGEAELLIVATPVDQIARLVDEACGYLSPSAVVTDAGSTKGLIVRALEGRKGLRFVGSHPLAGSEQRGPLAASASLFENKTCVVTPTDNTEPAALAVVTEFWQALGCTVVSLHPAEHDRLIARTSHLPHLVASALCLSVGGAEKPLVASGFRDTTRIASGDPALWQAIFAQNADAVLDALAQFDQAIGRFRAPLESGDFETVLQLLSDAKRHRDDLGS